MLCDSNVMVVAIIQWTVFNYSFKADCMLCNGRHPCVYHPRLGNEDQQTFLDKRINIMLLSTSLYKCFMKLLLIYYPIHVRLHLENEGRYWKLKKERGTKSVLSWTLCLTYFLHVSFQFILEKVWVVKETFFFYNTFCSALGSRILSLEKSKMKMSESLLSSVAALIKMMTTNKHRCLHNREGALLATVCVGATAVTNTFPLTVIDRKPPSYRPIFDLIRMRFKFVDDAHFEVAHEERNLQLNRKLQTNARNSESCIELPLMIRLSSLLIWRREFDAITQRSPPFECQRLEEILIYRKIFRSSEELLKHRIVRFYCWERQLIRWNRMSRGQSRVTQTISKILNYLTDVLSLATTGKQLVSLCTWSLTLTNNCLHRICCPTTGRFLQRNLPRPRRKEIFSC